MTITQQVQSKGRISIIKIQNFTIQRRRSVIRIVYGFMLVILGIVLASVDVVSAFTEWMMEVREGSFVYYMWGDPPYELHTEVYVFNYTNVPEFMSGVDSELKLQEIGPFIYKESRKNLNMTLDREAGILRFVPNVTLEFLQDESVGNTKDLHITVPNIALVAISTLAADRLGYIANAGAYYSMSALGAKLFNNLTVDDFFWGYHDTIVTIANNLLPGWIDFGKIGVLDRFYGLTTSSAEVVTRGPNKFSIHSWDDSAGLRQKGFTDMNSSVPCNRVRGAYEGLLLSPNVPKDKELSIFRKQACGTYPFVFEKETSEKMGFNYYRFTMAESAFSSTSPNVCKCEQNCLPEGFIDISSCYYGFPIALSKPHFKDVAPSQAAKFSGMKPGQENHLAVVEVEPTYGVPISIQSTVQVNLAARVSPANLMTRPVKDMVLPLIWVSLTCKQPSPGITAMLKLRFIYAPPLVIVLIIALFGIGVFLGAQGFYRIIRPKYKLIENDPPMPPSEPMPPIYKENIPRRRKSNVVISMLDNKGFQDSETARQAVSLLGIREEDRLKIITRN